MTRKRPEPTSLRSIGADFAPAIDQTAKLLDCLPGEVPERVRELVEGFPAETPPADVDDIIVEVGDNWRRAGYYNPYSGEWWVYTPDGVRTTSAVVRWWKLPPVPEVEK
jgi:hypothetical protein